jgi:hypothetical protein
MMTAKKPLLDLKISDKPSRLSLLKLSLVIEIAVSNTISCFQVSFRIAFTLSSPAPRCFRRGETRLRSPPIFGHADRFRRDLYYRSNSMDDSGHTRCDIHFAVRRGTRLDTVLKIPGNDNDIPPHPQPILKSLS